MRSRPRAIIAYPFLAALYSVLALAAKNSAEVRPHDLAAPLVVSLVAAAVAWALGRLIACDRHLGGIIALVIVVWFAWYGYMEQFLAHQLWLQPINLPNFGAPLILLLLSAFPYVIARRYSGVLPRLTRYLNASAAILVAFSTASLLRGWMRPQPKAERPRSADIVRVDASAIATRGPSRPDIYVIILDEYTGTRSLAANFGFDNHPFEDSLRRRGFFVPSTPHSNYVHTHLALAAMLNWRLLNDRPPRLKAWNGALGMDYAAIEDNRTWQYLRTLGYRFVFFPSAYPGTSRNRFADLQLPRPREVVGEFGIVWSRMTVLIPVASLWCRTVGCGDDDFPFMPAPAALIDWQFDQLAQLPDTTGPLFVFAHFLLPHEPYIFNADCTHREPFWPEGTSAAEEELVKAAYVRQIECVNRKVLRLADEVLARSKTPPIIVLQADHGHGRLGRDFATLRDAGRERVEERIDPFAAYYLPDHAAGVVYDSITPVNVLPSIFNHYFDAGIPLQSDATYWSTWQEPFNFTRVR